ncbi:MAG: PTS transporter subunit EIIC, partial [Enterococcus casseliflavus]
MKFIDKLAEKMVPFAQIIANNKYLLSLRDGFMVAFPATMFASIMIIIQNLPATFGLSEKLPEGFITFLNDFFGPIGNATMSITAIFVVFGIGYQLAGKYGQAKLFAGAISLSSFLMLLPFGSSEELGTVIPLSKLGAEGMFVGIITAI